MASTVEQIIVEVAMDSKDFNRDLKRVQVNVKQFGRQVQQTTAKGSEGMSKWLTKGKVQLVALAYALKKVTTEIFEAGDAMDSLNQKLIASSGSSKNAQKAWNDSLRIANKLGLDVKSVAEGFAKFQQAGGKSFGKDTVKIFEQLSTGVAGLGANSEETKGIFLAFSQILAKGKLSIQEVNQLAERGIGRNLIAEALGVDSIEGIDIKAPEAIQKIATFIEKKFKGASEKGANSIRGMSNKMANNFFELKVSFNEAIKPFRALFLSLSSTILSAVKSFMPEIRAFVEMLKNGVAFALRTVIPLAVATHNVMTSFGRAIWDIVTTVLAPFGDMLKDVFGGGDIDNFVETSVRGLFKLSAVLQNFVNSTKLGFLSLKKSIMKAFGLKIPQTLTDQINKLDVNLAKAFKKSDDQANKLLETLRKAGDNLKNFKEVEIKGDDGKGDITPKVEAPAIGGKGAGAIEFASTEAFKIIGSKVDKTANQNLNANKRTAQAVEKIERKTERENEVLDV